jgi:mRNA interferase MazF
VASNYTQGNIVSVNLGEPPQEVQGHEQAYERPCVIIKSFPTLQLAIVVPCTSKTPKYNLYTIVKLQKGAGGLSMDSYVLCHQIRTISFNRIFKVLGNVDTKDLLKLRSVLLDTLEL